MCILLDPNKSKHLQIKTFHDYASNFVAPHLQKLIDSCQDLHNIYDVYFSNTFKSSLRDRRAEGKSEEPIRIMADTPKVYFCFLPLSSLVYWLFQLINNSLWLKDLKFSLFLQIYQSPVIVPAQLKKLIHVYSFIAERRILWDSATSWYMAQILIMWFLLLILLQNSLTARFGYALARAGHVVT